MTWSKAPPTAPGFYFMRRPEDVRGVVNLDVAEVYYQDQHQGYPDEFGGLYWYGARYHGCKVDDPRVTAEVEWYGPIPVPPQEPLS